MPKGEPWLGEVQQKDRTKFPYGSKAGPFQADDRITSTEAGRHIIPEHDQAIARAMKQLYGGLVGRRCDPVEEFPADGDEAYGVPKNLDPTRPDATQAGRHIGDDTTHTAYSDLTGTEDGLGHGSADALRRHH